MTVTILTYTIKDCTYHATGTSYKEYRIDLAWDKNENWSVIEGGDMEEHMPVYKNTHNGTFESALKIYKRRVAMAKKECGKSGEEEKTSSYQVMVDADNRDKGEPLTLENGGAVATEQRSADQRIAMAILDQLGGMNKLNAMTGAYNFVAVKNGVAFKIKNQRANYIKIVLNSLDEYQMEIGRVRGTTYKIIYESAGIHGDQLKQIIESKTGMYLSMKEGGAVPVGNYSEDVQAMIKDMIKWAKKDKKKYKEEYIVVVEKGGDNVDSVEGHLKSEFFKDFPESYRKYYDIIYDTSNPSGKKEAAKPAVAVPGKIEEGQKYHNTSTRVDAEILSIDEDGWITLHVIGKPNTLEYKELINTPTFKMDIKRGLYVLFDSKEEGGPVTSMTAKDVLDKYFGSNVYPKEITDNFDIQSKSTSNEGKVRLYVSELQEKGYTVRRKSHSDFVSIMGVKKKMESGGPVEETPSFKEMYNYINENYPDKDLNDAQFIALIYSVFPTSIENRKISDKKIKAGMQSALVNKAKVYLTELGHIVLGFESVIVKGIGEYSDAPVVYFIQPEAITNSFMVFSGLLVKGVIINGTEAVDDWYMNQIDALRDAYGYANYIDYGVDVEPYEMKDGGKVSKGAVKKFKLYPYISMGSRNKDMLTTDYSKIKDFEGTLDDAIDEAKKHLESEANFVEVEVTRIGKHAGLNKKVARIFEDKKVVKYEDGGKIANGFNEFDGGPESTSEFKTTYSIYGYIVKPAPADRLLLITYGKDLNDNKYIATANLYDATIMSELLDKDTSVVEENLEIFSRMYSFDKKTVVRKFDTLDEAIECASMYSRVAKTASLEKGGVTKKRIKSSLKQKADAIRPAIQILYAAAEHKIKASELSFEEFSKKIIEKAKVDFAKSDLELAYKAMKSESYASGGSIEKAVLLNTDGTWDEFLPKDKSETETETEIEEETDEDIDEEIDDEVSEEEQKEIDNNKQFIPGNEEYYSPYEKGGNVLNLKDMLDDEFWQDLSFLWRTEHIQYRDGVWSNTGKYKNAVNNSSGRYIDDEDASLIIAIANGYDVTVDDIKKYDPKFTAFEIYKEKLGYRTGGVIPAHFGKGKNIDVFDYTTSNFDVNERVSKLFGEIEHHDGINKFYVAHAAQELDHLFGIEKEVIKSGHATMKQFKAALKSSQMAIKLFDKGGAYDYELLLFVPEDLTEIAKRIPAKCRDGGMLTKQTVLKIGNDAHALESLINGDAGLEEWVKMKITRAGVDMSDVINYLSYEFPISDGTGGNGKEPYTVKYIDLTGDDVSPDTENTTDEPMNEKEITVDAVTPTEAQEIVAEDLGNTGVVTSALPVSEYFTGEEPEEEENNNQFEYEGVPGEEYKEGGELPNNYRERLARFEIKENPNSENYKRAIAFAKENGYNLRNDVSYNGFVVFEKVLDTGSYQIQFKVYDDIIKKSEPDIEVYGLEPDFGNIMDKTKYRFKSVGIPRELEVDNLDELFKKLKVKEAQLLKEGKTFYSPLYFVHDVVFTDRDEADTYSIQSGERVKEFKKGGFIMSRGGIIERETAYLPYVIADTVAFDVVDKHYPEMRDAAAAEYANEMATYLYKKAEKDYTDPKSTLKHTIGKGSSIGRDRFFAIMEAWAELYLIKHPIKEEVHEHALMAKGGDVDDKFAKVMHEFKHGELNDRWGHKVTKRGQALAIAYSESRAVGQRMEKGGQVFGESYHLGDKYSKDFDYDGLFDAGLQSKISWGKNKLQLLCDSFQDVNYHKEAGYLFLAIKDLERGNKENASRNLEFLHDELKQKISDIEDEGDIEEEVMENGGEVNKKPDFVFRNFVFKHLLDYLKYKSKGKGEIEVNTVIAGNDSSDWDKRIKDWRTDKKLMFKVFTIGDIGRQMHVTKGDENLYLDIHVFDEDNKEYIIGLYTKENHNGLKEIASEIIQQFAAGGALDEGVIEQDDIKYEDGVNVSLPYYSKGKWGHFKEEAYKISNKFSDNVTITLAIDEHRDKKETKKEADRLYNLLKGVKTEEEYEKVTEQYNTEVRYKRYREKGLLHKDVTFDEFVKSLNDEFEKGMKAGGKVEECDYEVELGAVPNIDFGEDSHEGTVRIKKHKVPASSISDARLKVLSFIQDNDLGGGNIPRATLYLADVPIGYFSYNGRLWNMDNTPMNYASGGQVPLEKLVKKDKASLAKMYHDKFGLPALHHDYNTLVASLHLNKRAKNITNEEKGMKDGGKVGAFEYKTVDIATRGGIEEAEKLKEDGWKILGIGFNSIQFERPKKEKEMVTS